MKFEERLRIAADTVESLPVVPLYVGCDGNDNVAKIQLRWRDFDRLFGRYTHSVRGGHEWRQVTENGIRYVACQELPEPIYQEVIAAHAACDVEDSHDAPH